MIKISNIINDPRWCFEEGLRTRLETAIEESGLSWQIRVKIYQLHGNFDLVNGWEMMRLLKKELQQRN